MKKCALAYKRYQSEYKQYKSLLKDAISDQIEFSIMINKIGKKAFDEAKVIFEQKQEPYKLFLIQRTFYDYLEMECKHESNNLYTNFSDLKDCYYNCYCGNKSAIWINHPKEQNELWFICSDYKYNGAVKCTSQAFIYCYFCSMPFCSLHYYGRNRWHNGELKICHDCYYSESLSSKFEFNKLFKYRYSLYNGMICYSHRNDYSPTTFSEFKKWYYEENPILGPEKPVKKCKKTFSNSILLNQDIDIDDFLKNIKNIYLALDN